MSKQRIAELDRQVAESSARVVRLNALIERQRKNGGSTREATDLLAEVEAFIASLQARRRAVADE